MDGANLSLDGSSLLAGYPTSSVVSNANYGATRSVGDITASVLANSATAITMTSSQLFRSGSGNGGVFIGSGGIFAKNALGVQTFALDGTTGAGAFTGDISGATGTFIGDITTSGHVYATGGYIYAGGLYASIIGRPANTNSVGVYGESTNQQGVIGATVNGAGVQGSASSGGYGVLGIASSASAIAINAVNSYGGTALRVNGLMTMTHPELVTNLNADMVDSRHAGHTAGCVPISDGAINISLHADMVDGCHVANSSGGIPLSNTTWQTSLAAEWAFQAARLYDGNWGHYMSLGTAGGVAGSYTPTFGSACPRPGPPTWVQIIIDGNTGYMPVFF